jgi:hypothetical protein
MASAFDAVRDLRTPGLVVGAVYIDPQKVSKRIKTATQRMLRNLTGTGGWSSKSLKLFEMLMRDYGQDTAWMSSWGGVYNIHLTPQALRDQWCEYLELSYTLQAAKGRFDGGANPNRARMNMEEAVERVRSGIGTYASHFSNDTARCDDAVQPLMLEAFRDLMLPKHKAIGEALAARLDGTAPIPVSIQGI